MACPDPTQPVEHQPAEPSVRRQRAGGGRFVAAPGAPVQAAFALPDLSGAFWGRSLTAYWSVHSETDPTAFLGIEVDLVLRASPQWPPQTVQIRPPGPGGGGGPLIGGPRDRGGAAELPALSVPAAIVVRVINEEAVDQQIQITGGWVTAADSVAQVPRVADAAEAAEVIPLPGVTTQEEAAAEVAAWLASG